MTLIRVPKTRDVTPTIDVSDIGGGRSRDSNNASQGPAIGVSDIGEGRSRVSVSAS
jgi:hypothetical protein